MTVNPLDILTIITDGPERVSKSSGFRDAVIIYAREMEILHVEGNVKFEGIWNLHKKREWQGNLKFLIHEKHWTWILRAKVYENHPDHSLTDVRFLRLLAHKIY